MPWSNDPCFNALLEGLFHQHDQLFHWLPDQVERADARDPGTLRAAFQRLLNSDAARRTPHNVVIIMRVAVPFACLRGTSTISYIEKTDGSTLARRQGRLYQFLIDDPVPGDPMPTRLQQLGKTSGSHHWNLAYYTRVVKDHGPFTVCYATLDQLNQASRSGRSPSVRGWEVRLLEEYQRTHGELPPKNSRL